MVRNDRVLLLLWLVLITATAAATDCRDAELVLRNGKIVTMDARETVAQALAVRDAKIVAVGTNKEVAACAGRRTRVVDLAGKTVLPGLIDVHTHALNWGKSVLRGQIDLSYPQVRSIVDVVRAVEQRILKVSRGEWVVGRGWDDAKLDERRYVTRHDLDPVSPNNPVYLIALSGHTAVANTAALRLAGITRDTPDPQGGMIERDQSGEPTGVLKDTATPLVARHLPPDPPDIALRAAKFVSEKAVEVGLTTIHDIGLGPADMRGYQMANERGWLKLRVHMIPTVRSLSDAEQLVQWGVHTGFGNDRLKLGAVKMYADGGMGARTIAIYPPAVVGEPENLGLLIWKTEEMQKAHRMLAAAGWQLVTHAIGDRAINQVLDSYARTIKELRLGEPRFRIAHCGVSTPAIQKRLLELGVLVDGNPAFVYWIGDWFLKYGPERARWSYPGKSYIENQITVGAGSDVPVTPLSPWWGIWAAVVRRELREGQILAPQERLSVPEILRWYTRNGASTGFEENQKGSLVPGKLADFIVIDRDILSVAAEALKDVRVLKTFVAGELVYERQPPR